MTIRRGSGGVAPWMAERDPKYLPLNPKSNGLFAFGTALGCVFHPSL